MTLGAMSTHRTELPREVRVVLNAFSVGEGPPAQLIADAFTACVELLPPVRDVVLGSLMASIMARGPVAEDVTILLRSALAVDARGPGEEIHGGSHPVVVMAGSGKKGLTTLSISTPAALVAAAAGARIIKVGSASTSSCVGSRELVHALGVPERRTASGVRADLASCGFSFVAVEPEIPVLNGIYGGRFHAPNPFSFGLAPLTSPVRGDITVFGLAHPRVDVAAQVLSDFGLAQVDVVSTRLPSGHYLDEVGPVGEVRRSRVRDGRVQPLETQVAQALVEMRLPTELPPPPSSAEEAIEQTLQMLAGYGSDNHRAIVSLNAAYLLLLSRVVTSLPEGMSVANNVLRSSGALNNSFVLAR